MLVWQEITFPVFMAQKTEKKQKPPQSGFYGFHKNSLRWDIEVVKMTFRFSRQTKSPVGFQMFLQEMVKIGEEFFRRNVLH